MAYYRREVIPVGFGRLRLTDSVGLKTSHRWVALWTMALGTSYVRKAAPEDGEAAQSRLNAFASLDQQLSHRLRLTALGWYYRQPQLDQIPELDTFDVGLFLVFTPPR